MLYVIGIQELIESEVFEAKDIQFLLKWLEDKPSIAIDIETEGFWDMEKQIIMIQISDSIDSFVIDVRNRLDLILALKSAIESKKVQKLGVNLKFEYKFFRQYGIVMENCYDCFLVECLLTNGLEDRQLGLKGMSKKYLNIDMDKETRQEFTQLNGTPFTTKQILYGAGDVSGLHKIKELQQPEIDRLELQSVVNLENKVLCALGDIEFNGMAFDAEGWKKLGLLSKSKVQQYEQELDAFVKEDPKLAKFIKQYVQSDLFGEVERDIDIKWSSPKQVSEVFKAMGLELKNSSEKEINQHQYKFPLIKKFIDYKKQQKLITTYGDKFLRYINKTTGRIHTDFFQIVNTGRISSGSKKTNAPNLQNIPATPEHRACFIVPKGYKFVNIDYSGQELRITTEGSREPVWIDALNNNRDIHAEVASMMFKVPVDKVREKPEFLRGKTYRDIAKNLNFGIIYGMSEFKLAKELVISKQEAKDMITSYYKALPKLKSYLDACKAYGMKNGYIRTFKPYSLIRFFPEWAGISALQDWEKKKAIGSIERQSGNSPIQGSGAIVTKLALVAIRNYILDNSLQEKVKLISTVHDEINCEVKEDFAEEWSKIQRDLMIKAGQEIIKIVPVEVDCKITDHWKK
jgi:DNA polymerase-1